ncbi:MAG: tryptophan 7-halogenase [Marinagarivorans sp.]|nr:tryptophan 7-halogenase [Marinagarivorans sp.]
MIKNIVVVGGGTSGWMAAACFAKMLKPMGVNVTLVESTEIKYSGCW